MSRTKAKTLQIETENHGHILAPTFRQSHVRGRLYREFFFQTFHVNIFLILRNKRTTYKENHCDILCHSVEKKC